MSDKDMRTVLDKRIEELRVELLTAQRMLTELIALRELAGPVPVAVANRSPPTRVRTYGNRTDLNESILKALVAHGRRGVTARKLAAELNAPVGTISSRLSTMAHDGTVRWSSPLYYTPSADVSVRPLPKVKAKVIHALKDLKDAMTPSEVAEPK